jgi:hypothetical protein
VGFTSAWSSAWTRTNARRRGRAVARVRNPAGADPRPRRPRRSDPNRRPAPARHPSTSTSRRGPTRLPQQTRHQSPSRRRRHLEDLRARRPQPVTTSGASGNEYQLLDLRSPPVRPVHTPPSGAPAQLSNKIVRTVSSPEFLSDRVRLSAQGSVRVASVNLLRTASVGVAPPSASASRSAPTRAGS